MALDIAGDHPNFPPRGKGKLSIFHTKTGELVRTLNMDYQPGGIRFVGDGRHLATVHLKTIAFGGCHKEYVGNIWDVSTGHQIKQLRYPRWGVRSTHEGLSTSSDGNLIGVLTECMTRGVLRTGWGVKDIHRVLLWDLTSGQLLFASRNVKGKPLGDFPRYQLSISGNGKRLAVGGERIVVYEIEENPQSSLRK